MMLQVVKYAKRRNISLTSTTSSKSRISHMKKKKGGGGEKILVNEDSIEISGNADEYEGNPENRGVLSEAEVRDVPTSNEGIIYAINSLFTSKILNRNVCPRSFSIFT